MTQNPANPKKTLKLSGETIHYRRNSDGLIEGFCTRLGRVVSLEASSLDIIDQERHLIPIKDENGDTVYIQRGLPPRLLKAIQRSSYNPKKALIICEELSIGKSVDSACESVGVTPLEMRRWLRENMEFSQMYQDAMAHRADLHYERAMNQAENGFDISRDKLIVEAHKWGAQVSNPEVYGNKVKHSGQVGVAHTIKVETGIRRPGDEGFDPMYATKDAIDVSLEKIPQKGISGEGKSDE
jgi:hypothetical protein